MQPLRFVVATESQATSSGSQAALSVGSFMLWPVGFGGFSADRMGAMRELYALAYQQAQAALRPSFYQRCMIATPN